MYRKRKQLSELILCISDLVAVLFSLVISGVLRYQNLERFSHAENLQELFSAITILHIAAFYFLKVYENFFRRGRYRELLLSFKYNLLLLGGTALFGFGIKKEIFTSRLVMGYFFVLNLFMIWIVHIFFRNRERIFHRSGKKVTNIFIVTLPEYLEEIVEQLKRSKELTWNIAGVLLLDTEEIPAGFEDITFVLEKDNNYLEYVTGHVVDEVFIRVDELQKRERVLKNMILQFENMGIVVDLNLDLINLGGVGEKRIYKLEQYHVMAFSSRLFDYRMVLVKRVIDIIGACVGLIIAVVVGVILAPILLLESPGPLIFSQIRIGVNGRQFRFYKFRSMYVDAEKKKKELMAQNEVNGLMFKMDDDPRVTKVGKFIRKTSIDELPQFWNVLKGDMSLVGTRPPTLDEYEQYSYYQKRRISFRPGITGLWQISGRSDIKDFDEVVKLDLEYIDNWSLLLDIKIILKTILVVFKSEGAK